ncbi:MAG: hypothetical protein R3C68_05400 [Myxococcota bacterium]
MCAKGATEEALGRLRRSQNNLSLPPQGLALLLGVQRERIFISLGLRGYGAVVGHSRGGRD